MLPCIHVLGYVELGDVESQGTFYADQHSQQHSVVAGIHSLVLLGVDEFLVVLSEIFGGEGDEPHFLRLRVLNVLFGILVIVPIQGEAPQTDRIHDLALLFDFVQVVGVLLNFNCEIFGLGLIDGRQSLGLEPLLPVLVHVLHVAVGDGVEGGLEHFEQVVGDPRCGDGVVLHDPGGQVGVAAFILVVGATQLDGELDLAVD